MKIMFHIDFMNKGGAERVISVLVNQLVERNEIILVLNSMANICYPLNSSVKLFELDKIGKNDFLSRNIGRIKGIYDIINHEKPDAIVTFLPWPSFRVLYLKNKINIPVIVSDRNDPNQVYKTFMKRTLMKLLYKRADGHVFQTQDQKEYFNKRVQSKSVVIYNPLKKEFLEDIDKNFTREKKIVSVGRLDKQKNRKMLIDAFAKIHSEFSEYKLVIYGKGGLKSELEEQIASLNLQNYIELAGVKDNIKEEIYNASIFVLNSDYEGLPNALIEAMSLGLPCISTDCPCGGPKSFIKDYENGILTEVGNVDMLAEKLRELLSDRKLAEKLGNNAKKIRDELNTEKIVNEWEKYICHVVEKTKREEFKND